LSVYPKLSTIQSHLLLQKWRFNMDLGLHGARVLVTAASAGLGAATARRFSLEGALVVINSRNLDKLQKTAAAINAESGNSVFTHAGDVSKPEEAEKLVKNAVSMLGGLDIIVTNAGGPPAGTFEAFDYKDWLYAVDLTLLSTVNLIRAALPHLKESNRAAVLAVVSIAAKEPVDNLTLSNTIRPAVVGLTKTLSLEHGTDGIRFNSILPGTTDTERIDHLMQARAEKNNTDADTERKKAGKAIPVGRIGTPEEFANAAVFLCSPAAGFINGIALPVDGGAARGTF
jgi:3-oxoacyl-[acyl-carrier protein] reductase